MPTAHAAAGENTTNARSSKTKQSKSGSSILPIQERQMARKIQPSPKSAARGQQLDMGWYWFCFAFLPSMPKGTFMSTWLVFPFPKQMACQDFFTGATNSKIPTRFSKKMPKTSFYFFQA